MKVIQMNKNQIRMEQSTQPVFRAQSGGVSASMWVNRLETSNGTVERPLVRVERTYRDKSGEYRTSNGYGLVELIRLEYVVRQAIAAMLDRQAESLGDGG